LPSMNSSRLPYMMSSLGLLFGQGLAAFAAPA
jgi:hypothetical protein